VSKIKITFVAFLTAMLLTAGWASPAFAKKEERIRTEALEIFFPKSIKSPKSGCSNIPIRYEWRYFLNHLSVGAYIWIETKNEWTVGEISLEPGFSGGAGVADLKICATRWVGPEVTIDGEVFEGDVYQGVKKGTYFIDVMVNDFDNKEKPFQLPKRRSITLK
jgi:hypothetical protein